MGRVTQADRVLDVIDAGLQSSSEHGYTTDHAHGQCARCLWHDPVEDGDLCVACRTFLLGDSDEDPVDVLWSSATIEFNFDASAFIEAVSALSTSMERAGNAMTETFRAIGRELVSAQLAEATSVIRTDNVTSC